MVKQKVIKEKQKSSYLENLLFDSANRFRGAVDPLHKANDAKKVLEKVTPQLFESRQRFNLRKEPKLNVPIIPIDDAPGGMVPIGDSGWYSTPDEPADPMDCERYPDSPFCGGIPLSFKPIDIGLNIVIDRCNLGIRLNPVLAFIKLPPVAITYRKPECRNPPLPEKAEHSITHYCFDIGCEKPSKNQSYEELRLHVEYKGTGYFAGYSQQKDVLELVDLPENEVYDKYYIKVNSSYPLLKKGFNVLAINTYFTVPNFRKGPLCVYLTHSPSVYGQDYIYVTDKLSDRAINGRVSKGVGNTIDIFNEGHQLTEYVYRKMYVVSFGSPDQDPVLNSFFHGNEFRATTTNIFFDDFEITSLYCGNFTPPPAPPAPLEEEEMGCCELVAAILQRVNALDTKIGALDVKVGELDTKVDNLDVKVDDLDTKLGEFPFEIEIYDEKENQVDAQNKTLFVDNLAKGIQITAKRVEVANKIIGIEEYPASLPASLISKDEGWLGNLIPNADVSIPNLTKLIGWQIERFDEVVGQFEIPIEIKDSDPTTPGDQPVGIKLPNIAEAIAEMFMLLFQCSIDLQTLVNISTRTMLENGQDKQQNYITYRLLQSLVDWAGYKTKEHSEKLPMLFDPGKTRFDQLLKETEVNISVTEFADKHGLEADLMRFRKAASILDSVYYRKINPFADIKQQLMKTLRDKLALANNINGDDDQAFDQFLQDVEQGFSTTTGIDDPLHPYGRELSDRPRIRDLTNRNPPTTPTP